MLHPIVTVVTKLVTYRDSTLEGSVNVYRFIINRTTLSILLTVLVAGHAQCSTQV